jgi:serine/threonine protein kinase
MPNFKREVEMMQKLRHPNVVQFLDKFESGERVYIVTEFCSLGELTQHAENGSLKPEQILEMSWQLINGLEYIHQEGYIHRDLKPDNIFIAEGFIAKIGDCGLGKKYEEGVRNTRNVGTPLYTPPNILVGDDQYTQKCDVYSLGLIIYFLVFGEHLFGGARSIFDLKEKQETMLKQLDKLTKGLNCEERFKKIFRSTLAYEEQQRITSTQLKQLFQREFFSESKLKSPALLQLD